METNRRTFYVESDGEYTDETNEDEKRKEDIEERTIQERNRLEDLLFTLDKKIKKKANELCVPIFNKNDTLDKVFKYFYYPKDTIEVSEDT